MIREPADILAEINKLVNEESKILEDLHRELIEPDVMDVLSRGRSEGNVFYLPQEQLDRKLYERVNKVLENAGGKWNRKIKGHLFPRDAAEALRLSKNSGTTVDKKKAYQFFETPEEVAKRMVELAEIKDGMMVLEPSAGHGAIAEAIVKYGGPLDIGLIMVEIDPEKAEVLNSKKIANVLCQDFMGSFAKEYWQFDRVLMNPPFTKQQDIDHVLHAYRKCLYEGGRLVAIMSPGFTFRSNKKSMDFKKLVETNGSWEKLPPESFKAAGTKIETVLVVLNKPGDPTEIN